MTVVVPDKLEITTEALQPMLDHFRKELPREGCGFLAGAGTLAHRFYPIHNLNPERRRFLMDPLHVKRTETSIFRRNQRILGVCHSHPEGECRPSRWDIEAAFFDHALQMPLWAREAQVIALLPKSDLPVLGGFFYALGGLVEEVPLVSSSSEELCVFSTTP